MICGVEDGANLKNSGVADERVFIIKLIYELYFIMKGKNNGFINLHSLITERNNGYNS